MRHDVFCYALMTGLGLAVAAMSVLLVCLSPAFADPIPSFQTTLYNIESIPEGRTASHSFVFGNAGDSPLFLTVAAAPAGCTVIQSKPSVAAGETGALIMSCATAGRPGKFEHKNVARANDATNSPTTLTLSGEVVPPFLFTPADTTLYAGRSKTLTIRPNPAYSDPPPMLINITPVKVIRKSMQLSNMDQPSWRATLVLGAPRGPFPCDGYLEMTTNISHLPVYTWKCEIVENVR